MKILIAKIVFLAVISVLSLTSCKKQSINPTDELPASIPSISEDNGAIGGFGKFVIVDAVIYVDNHETGIKTKYGHFSSTKSRSSLRWGGSLYDIETIIKDTTTYSFWKPLAYPGIGKFVLNDDTTKYYGVNYIGLNRSIVEDPTHNQQNLGGSARPFSGQVKSTTDKTIVIQIQEVEGVINGENCRYYTQLTLKKVQEW